MKYISVLLIGLCAIGCSQPEVKQAEAASTPVNIDSLNTLFLDGWNMQDSAAVMNTLAAEAVVMNDSLIHKGTNAIATNWVSGGVKVLSNIKSEKLLSGASETIAYLGGSYTLDLTIPNGPVLKEKGNYNLVWEKQSEGNWKIKLVHIEDVSRMPDVK